MAFNDSGDKDKIGEIEINISKYFGERNKSDSFELKNPKYPSSKVEFTLTVTDPKEVIDNYDEEASVNITT